MKKIILFAAVLFSAVTMVNAQTSNEGTATLNVTLANIQHIEVTGDKIVNLNYTSLEDYLNGVESNKDNHLLVSSAGGFVVTVKALDLKNGTENTIAANTIKVLASKGSANGLENATFKAELPLSNDGQELFNSTKGGINKGVSVTYKGAGGDEYVENFTGGKDGTSAVYTTTVTYTIAPN